MDYRALPPEIQQALARGHIVLTANQRAARTLRRAFDLGQRALELNNWQPPPILAWDTWLASLWRNLLLEGHSSSLLLNASQEHTLWRAIIAADPATNSLRPVDALATTAADAWLLLHAYRGTTRAGKYSGSSDTRVFAGWAAEFGRRCARAQYLTHAQLPEVLRVAIGAGHVSIPTGVVLVGFDSKTPAQLALLDALEMAGTVVEEPEPNSPAKNLILAAAPTEHGELTACARWLREQLTSHPDARLAVIVPAIETSGAEIDRVFRDVLAPELEDIAAPVNSAPFEFSLGIPLATAPLVATAINLLHWALGPLPLDRVSALLLSPHFATEATEYLDRAEFDAFHLRQEHFLQPQISLSSLFLSASKSPMRPRLATLLKHLQDLRPLFNKREQATEERTHADWAAAISEILQTAGWAVPATLDSVEFQTRRKWESALDELATLDFDNVRVTFENALSSLQRIVEETLFAPESRHAPVQIMGPLESAGSQFDAIWFLRANDMAWPMRPSPNPLLPWQMQRDLAMPGATPSIDADHARHITERIASSAPSVLFSYAKESADGPQRPSPALASIALERRSVAEVTSPESAAKSIAIELVADVLPPEPAQGHVFRGGSAILQAQAACSFRAFAEKRLFASPLEVAELGLDARERGSLVHKVLEKFWAEVKTQEALKKMTTAQRNAELGRAIEAALARDAAKAEPGWGSHYLATERQRLLNLLGPWLDYEAEKRPAFVVKALEEKRSHVPVGPLTLDVRIDRIDTALANGEPAGNIILDYKTSDTRPAEWLGARPDEPQLPLYAILSADNLAGVAFAIVRPGKTMGMNGYETRSGVLPKGASLKNGTLADQVANWDKVLTTLAVEFHSGRAQVSPKQYPSTCRTCDQRPLCRLNIAALEAEANEDFADENPNANGDASEAAKQEVAVG